VSAPTVAIVDAYSSGSRLAEVFTSRGCRCVHVQSLPAIPDVYAPSYRPGDFTAVVVHHGDLDETVRALAAHRPSHVLAGIEIGVELADVLSERLGLLTNGTELGAARRDKYRMVETVRAADLPVAAQLLAATEEELRDWCSQVGGRVVVKPVSSAGSEGVYFCDTPEEAAAAFRKIIGVRNALAQVNSVVLAQEYLYGAEYYVNTVSRDGHHHVCDVWRTTHLSVNGVLDMLDNALLMDARGAVQDGLVEYTFGVLDALGIRHGPAHTELKLTPDGPRLIETGARLCGGDVPHLVRQAAGEGQLEWTADAYLDPQRFLARAGEDYRLDRYVAYVATLAPRSGRLVGYPKLEEIRRLESFHDLKLLVREGEELRRTVDDFTKPVLITLMHPVEEIVVRDSLTVRQLDGADFYEIG
jgi:biotin carboxylase